MHCSKSWARVKQWQQTRLNSVVNHSIIKQPFQEDAEEDKTTRDDEEEDDEGSPSRTRAPQNEDDEAVDYSDEDYLAEGANDYVDTYFDGGDEYEEDGDALGDEGAY